MEPLHSCLGRHEFHRGISLLYHNLDVCQEAISGADGRGRTADLILGKNALYLLSYARMEP